MTTLDATLTEIRDQIEGDAAYRLLAATEAVLKIADDGEHGALRWADPLPVPAYVHLIREAVTTALTGDHHG